MGPSHDAGTRATLLATARRIFALEGYAGASIRGITSAAGVNLGAVTYHFGSKEALYHAVLREVLTPLRDRVLAACGSGGSTRERIGLVVRAVFEHLWDNPDQPRFMVGLRLGERSFPPAILEIVGPVLAELVALVEEGQKEGFIRPGTPLLFVLSVLSQPVYVMIVTHRAPRSMLPLDPDTAEGKAAYLDHMVEFAVRGLMRESEGAER